MFVFLLSRELYRNYIVVCALCTHCCLWIVYTLFFVLAYLSLTLLLLVQLYISSPHCLCSYWCSFCSIFNDITLFLCSQQYNHPHKIPFDNYWTFWMEELNLINMWLQEDGAKSLLRCEFGEKLILHFGTVHLPPSSWDLNALDYYYLVVLLEVSHGSDVKTYLLYVNMKSNWKPFG